MMTGEQVEIGYGEVQGGGEETGWTEQGYQVVSGGVYGWMSDGEVMVEDYVME